MSNLWDHLGINATGATAVVVATTVLYLFFIAALRFAGQRMRASASNVDVLVVIVVGAILGRATMGDTPTVTGGLIAVVTLFVLEGVIGRLTSRPRWDRMVNNRAVLLMAGPAVRPEALRRFHITGEHLRSHLRQAGIRSAAEVAAVVLEPTGTLSVLRRGTLIDAGLLAGVEGAEAIPEDLTEPAGRRP